MHPLLHLHPEPLAHADNVSGQPPEDVVESIVPLMPVVLPIVGAVLMFLLAFIAVTMA